MTNKKINNTPELIMSTSLLLHHDHVNLAKCPLALFGFWHS